MTASGIARAGAQALQPWHWRRRDFDGPAEKSEAAHGCLRCPGSGTKVIELLRILLRLERRKVMTWGAYQHDGYYQYRCCARIESVHRLVLRPTHQMAGPAVSVCGFVQAARRFRGSPFDR